MNPETFRKLQQMNYVEKVAHALKIAREFYDHCGGRVFVSVGGLDSITLTLFLWKHIDRDIPAVSPALNIRVFRQCISNWQSRENLSYWRSNDNLV